ncbi:tail fiber domain-containing protein [Enterobacter hormaechei]|uniref:tail fiber domain-containing protein n=1 Tax=Enterobacter hormaechei TaxID=158836 RepID=UPI0023F81656|nr:tail fiber domain-containing protein [Enterobacter hormaechei]MDF7702150.1 tail fiber domain-containing protein [Enterobacter hormaechei subsp. steigerwaltii]
MTTYATNNPRGSMDPKDLFDNAQNLDFAVNDITKAIWKDRFGRDRKTYWGMEQEFSAQLLSQKQTGEAQLQNQKEELDAQVLSQEQRFSYFIMNSGYKFVGEYTDGPLTITEYNQLIRYQNEFYKLTAATTLPFTTTGNDATSWANDSLHFVSVGDAALRQNLSAPGGAEVVGYSSGDPSYFSFRKVADYLKQSLWFDDFKGTTDDEKWNSLAAYVSTAVVTSVCVMFSARKHIFSSNPATLTKPFELHGLGAKNTVLQFNDCDGVRGDLSGYAKYCQSKIAHMSVVANSINSHTGVYFKGFQTFSPHDSSLVLEGISIYGIRELDNTTPIASEWAIGLHLDNADEISISDLYIAGSQSNIKYATRTTSKGIFADTVTGLRISTSSISMCREGIEVINQSEGLIFDGLSIVAVDTGILLRDLINPSNNHIITNTHISAYTKGIEIRKLSDVSIHAIAVFMSNLFILERGGDAGKPMYTAIEAYVSRSALDSITIQSNSTNSPDRIGIVLPNQDITISNISAKNVGTLLYIDHVSTGYVYYSNLRTSGDLTAEIGGSPQFAVGAGLGSKSNSDQYTVRGGTFRTTDLQGRSQYENSGPRHLFGGGRQNSTVYLDFRTFPDGTAGYDGRIHFTGGDATTNGKADMTIQAGSVSVDGNISPRVPNSVSCGTAVKPWSGGYTQAAFTVTSDERYKTRPLLLARGSLEFEVTSDQRLMQMPYSDNILDAWGEVDFVQFQYIDRIEVKGDDGARWHVGVIAQRAQEAFIRHGLDPHRFAFFCYDPEKTFPAVYETVPATYEVVPAEYDENGFEIKPEEHRIVEPEHQKLISEEYTVGEKYGIRYEEALVIEAAFQRRNYVRLLKRIEALEGAIHG